MAALEQALNTDKPFRDLALPFQRDGLTLWWSLSAKPVHDEHGRHAGWRGVASDVTAARLATSKLSWLAHNDALTGLANRHQFRLRLASLLNREASEDALREGPSGAGAGSLAVLCLDLDHFKAVNDRLGHAAGDALLQSVANRLRGVARRTDLVARLGGDEFAILLPDTAAEDAERFAQRLLEALRQSCTVEGLRLSAQASIGMALAPRDGSDVDTLVNHADLALYAVKAGGRNGWRAYTPDMTESSRRRVQLEMALRGAIERDELHLVFQPQARLGDWSLAGCEALLRWRHPELGLVSPVEFIPVAEDAGMMRSIGDWVLTEACRQAASWAQPLVVSVNVSPRQALGAGFVERVRAALAAARLPPTRLELEITESVFLDESPATLDALRRLRGDGVRIALDDFGTGYSALSYLRAFPFDTLKIDRSFIGGMTTCDDARVIVKMILGLAHTLNMQTVAEGVEDAMQAQLLKRHGCELLQGYLLSRPLPADELSLFLRDWGGSPTAWSDNANAEAALSAPMPWEDTLPLEIL
jgi:diguanylate cyclase (GGDEF)-like protein